MSEPRTDACRDARVLVVDDSPLERFIVVEALTGAGAHVVEASDGRRAVERFREIEVDLLILDVQMPDVDGFECCRRIRALPAGAHVPILMLTGLDDIPSIHEAFDAGATDFYTKPLNPAILGYRVRYLLRASRTADELRRSRALMVHAQRLTGFGHWEWSGTAASAHWSLEVERILGEPPDFSQADHLLADQVHADDRRLFDEAVARAVRSEGAVSVEHRIVHGDGSVRTVHQEIEALRRGGEQGTVPLVGVIQDISARRAAEDRIRSLAFFDTVTGLPNRSALVDYLRRALAERGGDGQRLAVLFLDLDMFKRVNDTYGHSVGDELLSEVAERLMRCIRECDCLCAEADFDTVDLAQCRDDLGAVARLGGDEFVIVLSRITDAKQIDEVVHRIRAALGSGIRIVDKHLELSSSIGISVFPDDGVDVDELLKNADAAMYQAKSEGRDGFCFYTREINERNRRRLDLESALRAAIEQEEFTLHYQPIIGVGEGRVVSIEALVRWNRPGHGLVPPAEFIAVAEDCNLIVPLGQWVLERACRDMRMLETAALTGFGLSVNLSAIQFAHAGLLESIAETLRRTGLAPDRLELELTESILMREAELSVRLLERLKTLGVRIGLDDFGTGYSSLSYLKRFPIDTLKIDKGFIRDMLADGDDERIVAATIGLGRSLRLTTVAEGVERAEQLDKLRVCGVDRVQGYLFSRPVPLTDLAARLRQRYDFAAPSDHAVEAM